MKKEQKLVKDTITYMIANFGAKVLLLIIYPIYTYFIIPEELGNYDLIISTLTLFYPIVVFSINDAVFRWLLDENVEQNKEIISIGLNITIRNLIIIDIVWIIVNLIFEFQYGWLILCIINFGSMYPVFQQIARGLQKNLLFALSGLVYATSFVLFNCVFVIGLKMSVTGLLLSQIFAYALACLFIYTSLPDMRIKWWKHTDDKILQKSMIKYSLLLIPNSSCWWIMNASDRYLIRLLIGSAANGIYSVSHKFPSVVNMITSVFAMAWQEQAITEFNNEERDNYYSKIYQIYYQGLFCVSLVLIPITKWFTMFCVESQYTSAWKYSATLYIGSVFLALATFLGTGYLSVKNTKGSMITSMVGAAINIIVDLILLPLIGLEAAAISTMLGNFIVWISRWFQSKKYFTITVNWSKFIILIVINIVYGVIVRFSTLYVDVCLSAVAMMILVKLNKELLVALLFKCRK